MDTFTASNGVHISKQPPLTDRGAWLMVDGHMTSPNDADAMREFFRAEEDERLARWRHADFQMFVAYSYNDNWINVVDEAVGTVREHRREEVDACRDTAFPSQSERFARAYFDAHPEPKPWHNAKPGEVWALTWDGIEGVFLHAGGSWYGQGDTRVVLDHPIHDNNVTAGRRIWPEESA